jgi:flagellar motor switch protein FliG
MTVIVIGLSFIVIWLGTSFFLVRYVKKLRKELLDMFSDTEKTSKKESESIPVEYELPPFAFIKKADPKHLLMSIWYEHPQVIALVLAYLEPDNAAVILQNLPQEMQSDVSRRIATMDLVSPYVTREIERVLEKKLCTLSTEDNYTTGGIESIVEILKMAGRNSENMIIKELEDEDPELAEAIKISKTLEKPHRKIWRLIKGKSISDEFQDAVSSYGRK